MHGKLVNPDSEREILQERKGYLDQKLQLFADYFAPKTIGEFNGHYMMLTKLKGQFTGANTMIPTTSSWCCSEHWKSNCETVSSPSGLVRCISSRKESSTIQLLVKRCTCCSTSRAAQTWSGGVREVPSSPPKYEHQEDSDQTVKVWGDTAVVIAKLWTKGYRPGEAVRLSRLVQRYPRADSCRMAIRPRPGVSASAQRDELNKVFAPSAHLKEVLHHLWLVHQICSSACSIVLLLHGCKQWNVSSTIRGPIRVSDLGP